MVNIVTWEEVRDLIQGLYGDSDIEITIDTRVMDDLEFDSVSVMQLLSEIEEKFNVDFTDLEEFEERFNRCGDLHEGILELIKSNK